MRIVKVWLVAFFLIFTITAGWYLSQPAVIGLSRGINATVYDNPSARNVSTAIEYVSYVWGPLLVCFILVWAIMSSQKRDIESEMYG
jgi:hypothetical protein